MVGLIFTRVHESQDGDLALLFATSHLAVNRNQKTNSWNVTEFSKTYEAKWADMDPNRHMRHSVYLDYGAQTRVALFSKYGLPIEQIAEMGLGPILFREEIKYLREINSMDQFTVFCELNWMYKDGSRWSFLHRMFKESDIPVAELTVDGAWLDLDTRKLGVPSNKLIEAMEQFPRTDNFEWKKSKE